MIRAYKYKFHQIHKVQNFVNYVVLEVLCKAPKLPFNNFTSKMLPEKYQPLVDSVNSEYILDPLTIAYQICKKLKVLELKILRRAVINNNRIRELCNGSIKPVLYNEIENINVDLAKSLKIFCDQLYDESIKKEAFYSKFSKIDIYYDFLVGKSYTCRACGRGVVLTKFNKYRSGLDHYLPRKYYPFSSVNFRNLIPICDICNETYKNQKDPLLLVVNKGKSNEVKSKKKAYYPFSKVPLQFDIKLNIKKVFEAEMFPEDFEISFSSINYNEEVETWDRLFGIKENYLVEYCSPEMFSYIEESRMAKDKGVDYLDLLKTLDPWFEKRFLKIPLLVAIGL